MNRNNSDSKFSNLPKHQQLSESISKNDNFGGKQNVDDHTKGKEARDEIEAIIHSEPTSLFGKNDNMRGALFLDLAVKQPGFDNKDSKGKLNDRGSEQVNQTQQ